MSETSTTKSRWRQRESQRTQELINAYNAKRANEHLPPILLNPKRELKGKPRPIYNPPAEEMALMSEKELSDWRSKEKLKRKAAMQRENRAKKKALLAKIKAEMPDFKSKIEVVTKSNVYYPPPGELAKMSEQELCSWRKDERKKRNRLKQREIRALKRKERLREIRAHEHGPVSVGKVKAEEFYPKVNEEIKCNEQKVKQLDMNKQWDAAGSKKDEVQKQLADRPGEINAEEMMQEPLLEFLIQSKPGEAFEADVSGLKADQLELNDKSSALEWMDGMDKGKETRTVPESVGMLGQQLFGPMNVASKHTVETTMKLVDGGPQPDTNYKVIVCSDVFDHDAPFVFSNDNAINDNLGCSDVNLETDVNSAMTTIDDLDAIDLDDFSTDMTKDFLYDMGIKFDEHDIGDVNCSVE